MKAFPLSFPSAVALFRHGPVLSRSITASSICTTAVRPRTATVVGVLQTEGRSPCVHSSGYRLGLDRGWL